jgi:drug/metabolite transporter (DMT)-like permease
VLGYLVLPPMMWAGNAVVGRLMVGSMPPVAMNALRWVLVAVLLMPWALRGLGAVGSMAAIRQRWAYLATLGVLGVGTYNAMQYLALQTSTPLNATLIGSSVPVWMMLVGWAAYGQKVQGRQMVGAALSTAGVVLVIAQGQWAVLRQVHLVPGDLLMLAASLAWAVYSWMLARPPAERPGAALPAWDWAAFLQIQVLFGLIWAGACTAGEAMLAGPGQPSMWPASWGTWAAMVFIAVGPSILAYRNWGLGVQAVGPTMAAFFGNLTPNFAALWSALLLGQQPQWYHPIALGLITAGIAVSSRAASGGKNSGKSGPSETSAAT